MLLPHIGRSAGHAPSVRGSARVRKSLIVASATVLMFGPTAGVASAEPAPEPAADLPAALVEAIDRDLQIDAGEYLRRADVGQQLAGFVTTAQEQFPDTFGGAWLDDAGRPIVALAPGSGTEEARTAAESAGFEIRNVAKSETALREEKTAFENWLATQPPEISNFVRGALIDPVNNSIAVQVEHAGLPLPSFIDPALVQVIAPPLGALPSLSAQPTTTPTGGALLGGDGYQSFDGRQSLNCSLGFNGVDGGGNVVNITAGHCNPAVDSGGSATMHVDIGTVEPGPLLGTFEKSVLGARDYSIVRIEDSARSRFENNLVRVPGAAPIALDGVAIPVVGAPVCKSGARTGFSCGVISAVEQTVTVGDRDMTRSFAAEICALPGDSGGAIITGRQALGISSASSVADFSGCAIPDAIGALTGEAPLLFGQPISVVLEENPGLAVRTG